MNFHFTLVCEPTRSCGKGNDFVRLLTKLGAPSAAALGCALLSATAFAADPPYDLLLSGGHVIDAKSGTSAVRDVAIAGGKIAAVAAKIDGALAFKVVDVSGLYVTPGLRLRLPDQTSLYGLVQLPPYRYVNETQLAVRAAFLVGVSKTF